MRHQAIPEKPLRPRANLILLSGLAGGLAEIVWIMVYSGLTSASAMEVARQITATVLPLLQGGTFAVTFGIVIHFLLSVVLATGFVLLCYRPVACRFGLTGIVTAGMASLALVWALNFLVILPILNPAFTGLMPYTVTGVSKLLFGAVMGGVLTGGASARQDNYRMVSMPSM